jgi:hypothetical protein
MRLPLLHRKYPKGKKQRQLIKSRLPNRTSQRQSQMRKQLHKNRLLQKEPVPSRNKSLKKRRKPGTKALKRI